MQSLACFVKARSLLSSARGRSARARSRAPSRDAGRPARSSTWSTHQTYVDSVSPRTLSRRCAASSSSTRFSYDPISSRSSEFSRTDQKSRRVFWCSAARRRISCDKAQNHLRVALRFTSSRGSTPPRLVRKTPDDSGYAADFRHRSRRKRLLRVRAGAATSYAHFSSATSRSLV